MHRPTVIIPPYVVGHFSLAVFKILFFNFGLQPFIMTLGMAFIDLILLRVCRACSICQFMSFTKFGKLWGFISSNIFPSLFLLSFRTPVIPLRESPALLLGLHPEATWIHMGAGLQPRCSDGEGAGLWGPAVMAVGFSGAPSNWEIFLPLIAVSFGAPVPS